MSSQQSQTNKNAEPRKKQDGKSGKSEDQSASQKATDKAKTGQPLSADRPRDRSPKQENL